MYLENPITFAERFLEGYIAHGLGSISKRDIDVLVFYLLLEDGRYDLPRDIFRACRELKLSETKVRNLYQEVQLRYMQYDLTQAKEKFVTLVQSGALERDRKGRVTFIVRDPLLRQYFEEWVAEQDGFADSSFNKNLVTVSVDVLAKVIEHLAVADFDDIAGRFTGELESLNEASDMKSLARQFAEAFATSAGATSGEITVYSLAAGLKMLFTKVMGM